MDRRIGNPKDSNDYSKLVEGCCLTLKGSNVYRTSNARFHTTPSGSHLLCAFVFYKHEIPSGLLKRIKLKTIEATIQKGLAELKVFV